MYSNSEILFARLEVSNLELTSIEGEVHDVTIDSHGEDQIVEDVEEPPQEVITSSQAISMEKCIMFTDHIMTLLQQLHGEMCSRPGCGRSYLFRKTYV